MNCCENVEDVASLNVQLCTILEERLEVDTLTLEPKSVLFFELPSSNFFWGGGGRMTQ